MAMLIDRLKALSSAEDFFAFFGVPYEEAIVQVNRLHILKRFYQYLHKAEGLAGLDDIAMMSRYRGMLAQAYQDFVVSTPAREKVFKVFQSADGTQHVQLASLRESLPTLRREARAA
jgi:nitrogenase-stabilizing/protective protein